VALPSLPLVRDLGAFDRFVEELPELRVSIAGVAQMGLATGLSRRIDAAWAMTTALLGALCLYALFRQNHVIASALIGLAALALALMRRAFYRHSRLGELAPDRRVGLAIAFAFAVAIVGGLLWAGSRPAFAEAPWWSLLTDEHLGR